MAERTTKCVVVRWDMIQAGRVFEFVQMAMYAHRDSPCNVIIDAPYHSHYVALLERIRADPEMSKHTYVWTSDTEKATSALHTATMWSTVKDKRTEAAYQLESKAVFQLLQIVEERGINSATPFSATEARLLELMQTLRSLYTQFDEQHTLTSLAMCLLCGCRRDAAPVDYDAMVAKYCCGPDAWRIAMHLNTLSDAMFTMQLGFHSIGAVSCG
jgi:hypothetical protein